MKFSYEAYNAQGRRVGGVVEAAGPAAARESLRAGGLYVTALSEVGGGGRGGGGGAALEEIAETDRPRLWQPRLDSVASFTRELSVLVATGVPVADALGAVERQERDEAWAAVIGQIRMDVERGRPLSDALAQQSKYFGAVYRSLVAAGEESGELDVMLGRLAVVVRQQAVVRRGVVGAVTYPAGLAALALAAAAVMLLVVVPRFADMFRSLNADLPATTEALLLASDALRTSWWAALAGLAAAGVGAWAWLRTSGGRSAVDRFVLTAPIVSGVSRGLGEARIARLLGTLMAAHVSLVDAIDLVGAAMTNGEYRRLIGRARRSVVEGDGLTAAFEASEFVSPRFVEALRTGEATGRLATVLTGLADHADGDNESAVRGLTRVLEPVIITGMGAMVAALSLSLFLPLFDLTSAAGGGP